MASDVWEVLDRISDGFVALDREWRFTYVNGAASRFFDRGREELLGKELWQVFPGLVGTAVERELREAAATVKARSVELRGPISGRLVELRVYPSPQGTTAYFLDITSTREAEAALRDSEAKYRALFEHSLDGFALTAPDGRIIDMNPAGCEMLRRRREDVLRVGRSGLLDENDPRLRELLERRRRDGHARGELTMLRGDGTHLPVDISSVVFTDAHGEQRTSLTFRDLTEQRRAMTTIELLERTSAVVQSSLSLPDVLGALATVVVPALADIVVIDVLEVERIVRVVARDRPGDLPAVDVLRSSTPARRTERGVAKVLHTGEPEVVPKVTDQWLQQAAQSDEHLAAARALDPTSVLMVPLVARGRIVGVLSLSSLHGTRQYSEADLPLARGVADRAALAIDNARLYAEAIAARERRDEMLRIVSHDLRSPLNAITLMATVLARRSPSSQVEAIQRSVAQADRLVQDLVAITAMEAGPLPIDRGDCPVRDLLDEVADLHRPKATDREVALSIETSDEIQTAMLDRHRMVQALGNLVDNAIKFTPSEGKVTLRARPDGPSLVLEVEDSGVGIAPEEIPHVFDRFWVGRQGKEGGLGLGLAIAKGVVDAHAGTIAVRSTPGQGTTFEIRLPR